MSQLHALAVSLTMEVPVAVTMGLALGWHPRGDAMRLSLVALSTTLLTHPVAWWGYRGLRYGFDWERWPAFVVIELLVCAAEAWMFWRLTRFTAVQALVVAFVVNSLSAFWGWEFAALIGLR